MKLTTTCRFRILTLLTILFFRRISTTTESDELPTEENATKGKVPSLNSWPAYKQLFETKRKAEMELIKSILGFDKAEKQYRMMDLLYRKIKEVLSEAKMRLDDADYTPSETDFPTDDSIRDALSQVIENTVLFSDLSLRFPTIVHRSFDHDESMRGLITWCCKLIETTKATVDTSAAQTVNLASQELRLVPQDPDFVNPFTVDREIKISSLMQEEIIAQKKLKKKKTGPRLSRTEL